jgi:hypothetical protein
MYFDKKREFLFISLKITRSAFQPLSNILDCDSQKNLVIVSELIRQKNREILLKIVDQKNLSFFAVIIL